MNFLSHIDISVCLFLGNLLFPLLSRLPLFPQKALLLVLPFWKTDFPYQVGCSPSPWRLVIFSQFLFRSRLECDYVFFCCRRSEGGGKFSFFARSHDFDPSRSSRCWTALAIRSSIFHSRRFFSTISSFALLSTFHCPVTNLCIDINFPCHLNTLPMATISIRLVRYPHAPCYPNSTLDHCCPGFGTGFLPLRFLLLQNPKQALPLINLSLHTRRAQQSPEWNWTTTATTRG